MTELISLLLIICYEVRYVQNQVLNYTPLSMQLFSIRMYKRTTFTYLILYIEKLS